MSESAEIALYEEMALVHDQMLAAARSLAWDEVIRLEGRSAAITRLLAAQPPTPEPSAAHSQRKTDLINSIVARQEQVREEINAWRGDVAPLLASLAAGRPGA